MTDLLCVTDGGGVIERSPLLSLHNGLRTVVALIPILPAILLYGLLNSAHADEPARIAIALPVSGPQKAVGDEVRAAVELALIDLRVRGGDLERAVSVSFHDDACSSEGGLSVARQITADLQALPAAVLGHACPSAARAAAPIYAAAGVAFIAAGSLPTRASSASLGTSAFFRLPAEGSQGALIGSALLGAGFNARIAFMRDRTQYSQEALQAAFAVLQAGGRSVSIVETFAGAEKDFSAMAMRIKAAGITHIALAAFPSEAALLIGAIRQQSPAVVILATDQLADSVFGRLAGARANGVNVAFAPDYRQLPKAADIARRLQTVARTPSRTAIASYAALEVLASAVIRDNKVSEQSTIKSLATKAFDTILGPVRFDATGSANLPSYVFYTWNDGTLVAPAP